MLHLVYSALITELTGLLKEKNQMIEKLELALEKQQDGMFISIESEPKIGTK